jgi:hypothetical protein
MPWRRLREYSSHSFLTLAPDGVSGQCHASKPLNNFHSFICVIVGKHNNSTITNRNLNVPGRYKNGIVLVIAIITFNSSVNCRELHTNRIQLLVRAEWFWCNLATHCHTHDYENNLLDYYNIMLNNESSLCSVSADNPTAGRYRRLLDTPAGSLLVA